MKEFRQTYRPTKDRSNVLFAAGLMILIGGSALFSALVVHVLSK